MNNLSLVKMKQGMREKDRIAFYSGKKSADKIMSDNACIRPENARKIEVEKFA